MASAPTIDVVQGGKKANQADSGQASDDRDLVLKVLGAVGTGIGILGFVTFFGGAILWVRAKEAGLPASETVAVVPKGVLVTTGASFLVPAMLLALLAVILLAAVHLGFSIPARVKANSVRRKAHRLRYEADKAMRDALPEERVAASAREQATKASAVYDLATQTPTASAQLPALEEQARDQQELALGREKAAQEARNRADDLETKAQNEAAQLKFMLTNRPGVDTAERWVERAAALLVLTVLPLLFYGTGVGSQHKAILIILAVAVAILCLGIYEVTEKFLWFGVVAFVAVGIYTGCATYFRTIETPKVEPAAALRGDRPPLVGLFIADTADNVYLGTFRSGTNQPRLLVIPKAQVTDLAVGPLLAPAVAKAQAFALAIYECHQRIEQSNATKKVPAITACTRQQDAALAALQAQR
jgi:hypothetical protein